MTLWILPFPSVILTLQSSFEFNFWRENMELGNNIKELRKKKGLRQEQLAEAMNVSTASVSKWETNQSYPELTLLAELADFFEVSIDTLVGHSLNADRLETLIAKMKRAVDNHEEETAEAFCKRILRNYPNIDRAVEACSSCYYKLFIHTHKKIYMEHCIAQTKRLMNLKHGEPEKNRLERIHYLANQYSLLRQWDTAKNYYEQSNVNGSSQAFIAECLLQQGQAEQAVMMVSDALVESVFHGFQAVNILAEGWIALGQQEKACAALQWIYGVMESMNFNPTTLLLILMKLAGLYEEQKQTENAKDAFRRAAELVKKNSKQEVYAEADFLQIENAQELLTSATDGNLALLVSVAGQMGEAYADIVNTVLQ